MPKTVTFFYDFLSPYTYLAQTQFSGLKARTGAEIACKPMSVLAVMDKVGNQPTTIMSQAKGAYAFKDLRRWAERYGVPIESNPHMMETNADLLLRGSIAAVSTGQADAYNKAVFEAVWTKAARLATRDDLEAVLTQAGLADVSALLDAAEGQETADQLAINNQEAADAGVFGSPSFVVDGDLYFGNDRLDFLEAALTQENSK